MWCIKSQMNWLKGHAEWDQVHKRQICKVTKTPIEGVKIGRSVHTEPDFLAGSGEVRAVIHWFCPDHGGMPAIKHGDIISEENLIDVAAQA
jgi:hypothetical protein